MEDQYNRIEDYLYNSHKVSHAIIRECARLCQENAIPLVVAGIYADPLTREMLDYCGHEGFPGVDISVDLRLQENSCLPSDPHPSAIANRRFADKLEAFLAKSRAIQIN